MAKTIPVPVGKFHSLSVPSFCPLLKHLKEIYNETGEEYENAIRQAEEVVKGVDFFMADLSLVSKSEDAIRLLMDLYFKGSSSATEGHTITAPFSNTIIYSSAKEFPYLNNTGKFTQNSGENLLQKHLEIIYQLILTKFYGLTVIHSNSIIVKIKDERSGLLRFLELELAGDLIDITPCKNLPKIDPADLLNLFSNISTNMSLQEMLPLNLFSFEGVMVITERDVTVRETIGEIKNELLAMPRFIDPGSFDSLQLHVRNLVQLQGCELFFTSTKNNCSCEGEDDNSDKLVQPVKCVDSDSLLWVRLNNFFTNHHCLVIPELRNSSILQFDFLQPYLDALVTSLAIFPLKSGDRLIGTLSIVTTGDNRLHQKHLYKLEPLMPLLVLALGKHTEKMDDEIDKVIREQFTAVQSSVNWKFTETARNYLNQKNNGQEKKIENIVFENVFPLYGSVDVRNSSIERSSAIQTDLLEQLELANGIIRKCKKNIFLFSLQEIEYRIDKYITGASLVLFPGDELAIQNFLDEEITALFNHLKTVVPTVSDDIDNYFFLLNSNTNKLSKQCAAFEESILMINDELVKFINQEQKKIQEVYAHYFEYFVTDGVDFNIYIGQSITPDKPFDNFYLKNLKIWQLTTLVKAAQKIRNLQDHIPVALDTTQLILAHSKPISISFRVAERKFDVDGAYNIHYEIIKKRIDKIKIMGSNERLTQPGKIAIVFAHDKEAAEYASYIEYLQNEGLLEMNIEYFDLEELPGVRGLKALRIGIRMDKTEEINGSILENFQLKAVS